MKPDRWQKVDQIFQAALQHRSDERKAFIDEACRGDEELRLEVESLLAEKSEANRFLEEPAMAVVANDLANARRETLIGRNLGAYKIISLLGEGGMGEVYKARDTRLNRIVAIKVLPEHIAKREDLRARFEREARAVASLNHPHICTLHDIGNQDGAGYMVMEYMEGETLAARIEKGAIPLDQALKFATQIADALDRAHRAGVTHRDVKPQNIMLTRDGVKVLDFGLAKSAPKAGPDEETLAALTAEGTVLGTPQYMAPEQFAGREADARSDIWAFGAVLYEMLTGRRAFQEKSYASLLGAILSADPAPMALKPFTPALLERLVRRCLAKDSEDRYYSMHDVVLDLRTPLEETRAPSPQQRALQVSPQEEVVLKRKVRLYQSVLTVTAAALFMFAVFHFDETPPQRPLRRFGLVPPVAVGNIGLFTHVAISPNGRHIAFVEARAQGRLWVHDLDRGQARAIEATEGAFAPFWSPDSSFIGFAANEELKTVSVQAGLPRRVCRLRTRICDGASWSPDGKTIAFTSGTPGVLWEVPAQGGTPQLLISMEELGKSLGEPVRYIARPHFLPLAAGPRTLAFTVSTTARPNLLMVKNLQTGQRELLGPGDYPFYSPSGHLLYQPSVSSSELWALPFSLNTLRSTGDAFLVVQRGHGATIAEDGTLVYSTVAAAGPQRLVWIDRESHKKSEIARTPAGASYPVLSRDGRFVAVAQGESQPVGFVGQDVWVYDVARGVGRRLSTSTRQNGGPVWSPSGQQIAYTSGSSGYTDIVVQGSGVSIKPTADVLEDTPFFKSVLDWSRNGQFIIYQRTDLKTGFDLYYLQRTEDHNRWERHPFLQTLFNETGAKFSPDGRYVAYASDESGQDEIYVRSFPGGSGGGRVSANGGTQVRWGHEGKELFYLEGETLVATSVSSGPTFEVGSTTRLFDHPLMTRGIRLWNATYDATTNGQRFVVIEDIEPTGVVSSPIHIVQNWYEEFRDRDQN